ncbi:MAG: hypothetical protein IV105_19285 [Rhizobacter sp.]|nr:hypothetical protein [Rhizobacter sp.]
MSKSEQIATVHVVAYRKAADTPVQVAVTPELLDLTQFPKGPVTIQFKLDTKGYHFHPDGKAIVFTSPGSKKTFGSVKLDDKGRVATVRNKNVDGLAFAYNVTVIDESTGLAAVLDPVIQNNTP